MQPVATDLDHIGTIVPDLDRAQRTFERLGFTLTQRSHHQGAVVPAGPSCRGARPTIARC